MILQRCGRCKAASKATGSGETAGAGLVSPADDPAKTVTEDYKTDCIPRHVPTKKDDWVYVRVSWLQNQVDTPNVVF